MNLLLKLSGGLTTAESTTNFKIMTEVERQTSKSGKVFRIVKDHPIYPIFTIEYLKVYTDGREQTNAWFPATNPTNKVFGSLVEAQMELSKLLLEK
jgi:hypothetical protein